MNTADGEWISSSEMRVHHEVHPGGGLCGRARLVALSRTTEPSLMSGQMPFGYKSVPFFILGNPRSGTTLLRLMLNNHPSVAVPMECGFAVWLHDSYKGIRTFDLALVQDIGGIAQITLAENDVPGWNRGFFQLGVTPGGGRKLVHGRGLALLQCECEAKPASPQWPCGDNM